MKNLKMSLLLVTTLVVGLSVNNFAMADTRPSSQFKVAVVNVPAVVEASGEVMSLKKEQQKKMQDLQKWLTTVRADVDKQTTKEGKEALVKKYDAEFAKKQEVIKSDYSKKLQQIDKDITTVIEQERKAQGYDIVLSKGTVLSGGTDITQEIAKKVK